MKILTIIVLSFSCVNIGCSQNSGPGYSFKLFENTPNWNLAKAVQNENEKEIKKLLKKESIDINLQEPKFGNTLLLLAIGNDKLISTRVLLEEGANINVPDLELNKPIHEATRFINFKNNSLQIIKLLIKYGANVNDTAIKIKNGKVVKFYVPLMGASQNLECGKLLLDVGGNPYVTIDGTYLIWTFMDNGRHDENIFFANYLIVEKKMPIPNPIDHTLPDNIALDVFYFLNKENFGGDPKKEEARSEILKYLRKINFPKSGVFNDTLK